MEKLYLGGQSEQRPCTHHVLRTNCWVNWKSVHFQQSGSHSQDTGVAINLIKVIAGHDKVVKHIQKDE